MASFTVTLSTNQIKVKTMLQLQVNDMTCGHCVARVTKAVKEVDAAAQVEVNLEKKSVSIGSSHAAPEFEEAIREAGYTPLPA